MKKKKFKKLVIDYLVKSHQDKDEVTKDLKHATICKFKHCGLVIYDTGNIDIYKIKRKKGKIVYQETIFISDF